jgi:hypothetical protein
VPHCRWAGRRVADGRLATPDCVVGQALAFANISVRDLEEMGADGVRDLYLRGELPITLTLGALAVFDAAQRSQDRGCRRGDVLEYATDAAVNFLDLPPDTVFDAVRQARTTGADWSA